MKLWGAALAENGPGGLGAERLAGLRPAPGAQDVRGSLAWAQSSAGAGVLSPAESAQQICSGLKPVAAELESGVFQFQESDEDIHTAVERRLGELIGPAGRQAAHRAQPQRPGGHRSAPVAAGSPARRWRLPCADLQAALLERAEAGPGSC